MARKARNFIQETIDQLRRSADNVEKIWKQFQAGEIDKETFEDEYTSIISCVIDDVQEEQYSSNNGCKYHGTCPTSEYFKKENI